MTAIEGAAVIQSGRPPVDPPTRSRMSAARRFEHTFSTQCRKSLAPREWQACSDDVQHRFQQMKDCSFPPTGRPPGIEVLTDPSGWPSGCTVGDAGCKRAVIPPLKGLR
jgi:hypothetical protein